MTQNFPSSNVPPTPQHYPYHPHQPEPDKNGIGLAALITAIVGFIFACLPGALIVGWVLLPVAFILALIGITRANRKKGTSIAALVISVVGTIVGFLVFMTVVSDAIDESFSGSDLSTDSTDGDSESSDVGTRENPLPIGETVRNDDWEITPGSPYEATEEVLEENTFNDEPPAGLEYWILPIEATYIGDESARADFEITVKFVSDEGHTHNAYDPSCGVIPGDLSDFDELYNGATAEGNTCVPVPEGAPGLWSVSTTFGSPVFFTAD